MKHISEWLQQRLWSKLVPKRQPDHERYYLCVGGPWHGRRLHLSSPTTGVFRVGDKWHGRYVDRSHSDLIYWKPEEE